MTGDPIARGLASGWKAVDAAGLERDRELETDVVIVGSGAGGAVSAEILAQAGLDVVIVEEGPLVGAADFRMREREAYPQLYQDSAARQTLDRATTILQGRCVGGSTTVNWTTSFRTPRRTLAYWRSALGLASLTDEALDPWFRRMEERLAIAPWPVAPNENNDVLRRGCGKLRIPVGVIARNVVGCANLGYCGMGCPTNAKQSMLVTTIPAAMAKGATLLHRARVTRLEWRGDRVGACEARAIAANGAPLSAHRIRVRARHFVLAAGAIGTPGVLLRSRVPDPQLLIGRRTFLHPTVVSGALMAAPVAGYFGAPQSVYSDHFLDSMPLEGPIGFKLEAAPVHPVLAAITLPGFGAAHSAWLRELERVQVVIALARDGFHPESPGGRVLMRNDGSAVLDYPLTDYLFEGMRRAYLVMAQIQFAAGARTVLPMHDQATAVSSWRDARDMIARLPMRAMGPRVVSAHVMGGCAMGADPRASLVDAWGRFHHLANVSVHDGSVFPTSLGANPQLSIFALAARFSARLAESLGRPAARAPAA